jgi:hypothetical protein
MYWVAIIGQRGTIILYSLAEDRVNSVVERDPNLIVFEAYLVTEIFPAPRVKIENHPEPND